MKKKIINGNIVIVNEKLKHDYYCLCDDCSHKRKSSRTKMFGINVKTIADIRNDDNEYDRSYVKKIITTNANQYKNLFNMINVTRCLCIFLILVMISFFILININAIEYNNPYFLMFREYLNKNIVPLIKHTCYDDRHTIIKSISNKFLSILVHQNLAHITMNLISFAYMIDNIKLRHILAAIFLNVTLFELIMRIMAYHRYCSIGFSGVLFSLSVKYNGIPNTIISLASAYLIISNASIIGHTIGFVSGLLLLLF